MAENQTSPASAAGKETAVATRAGANGAATTPEPRGTVPMSHLAAPGTKHARFMPPDFSISMRSGYGTVTYSGFRPAGERRQPMRGFDPDTYTDIVDYILRDTSPDLGSAGRRVHLRHLRTGLLGCTTTTA